MFKTIGISIVLVGIAGIGLAFNIVFRKNGRFPQTSVGKNKKMRELGLNCAKSEEIKCRNEIDNIEECAGCGCS